MSAILESALDAQRKAAANAWDAKAAAAMVASAKLDARSELAQQVGRTLAEAERLRAELACYSGINDRPTPGHLLSRVRLDGAPVLVEYTHADGVATVVSALINGTWIGPRDYIADSVVDAWDRELSE